MPYSDEVETNQLRLPNDNDPIDDNGVALFEKPLMDHWIHAEFNFPPGEEIRKAKVICRSKYGNG